jgi:outer membrane murein-binding lipoprotein Lpp
MSCSTERAARKKSDARADQFAKKRNELAAAVGRMEGKIEAAGVASKAALKRSTRPSTECRRNGRAQAGACIGMAAVGSGGGDRLSVP